MHYVRFSSDRPVTCSDAALTPIVGPPASDNSSIPCWPLTLHYVFHLCQLILKADLAGMKESAAFLNYEPAGQQLRHSPYDPVPVISGPTRRPSKPTISLRYLTLGFYSLPTLLPCFLRWGGLCRKQPLAPTFYLDALRGYAAWSIMNRHRFDLFSTWLA